MKKLKFKGANAYQIEIENRGSLSYSIKSISFIRGPNMLDVLVNLIWPTCNCEVNLGVSVAVNSIDHWDRVLSKIGESVFDLFNSHWEVYHGKCPVCTACNYELDFTCDAPNNDYELWQREEIENALSGKKAITGRIYVGIGNEHYTYTSDIPLSFDDVQIAAGYVKKRTR